MLYLADVYYSTYFIFDEDDFSIESSSLDVIEASGIELETIKKKHYRYMREYPVERHKYALKSNICVVNKKQMYRYGNTAELFKKYKNSRYYRYVSKNYCLRFHYSDDYCFRAEFWLSGVLYEIERTRGKFYINKEELYEEDCERTLIYLGYYIPARAFVMHFGKAVLEFTTDGVFYSRSIARRERERLDPKPIPVSQEQFLRSLVLM